MTSAVWHLYLLTTILQEGDHCKLFCVARTMTVFQGPDFEDIARKSEASSEEDDSDDDADEMDDEDEPVTTPVQQQR